MEAHMRRLAVITAVLALSLVGVDSAAAAFTTVTGTYAGSTTALAVEGSPPDDCLDFANNQFTGNTCLFPGTGLISGTDENGDPWNGGYQAHLSWAPQDGCAPVSGDVSILPDATDPENPPPGGYLEVTVDPTKSTACSDGFPTFTAEFTVHIEGTINGVAILYEGMTGTYSADGTIKFNFGPSVDEGTLTFTYGTPDPLPTSAEECTKDGWEAYGIFKNQGDCVSFVATGGRNEPAG
jgi:hypothetical protein